MQTISLDQAMEEMEARNAALEEKHRQETEQTRKEMEAMRAQMTILAVSFMCIRYQR